MTGSVHSLKVPQPERYLTRAELAERMGVSTKSVDRLVAAGMPSETFGLRSRRFLASQALAWARNRRGDEAA